MGKIFSSWQEGKCGKLQIAYPISILPFFLINNIAILVGGDSMCSFKIVTPNNKISEKEIKKMILFTIASKK